MYRLTKKHRLLWLSALIFVLTFSVACSTKSKKKKKKKRPAVVQVDEQFVTLADVPANLRGPVSEDLRNKPNQRIVTLRVKAAIRNNDHNGARERAQAQGRVIAVDQVVRDVLTAKVYNKNYKVIERFIGNRSHNFVVDQMYLGGRPIYKDAYYGIFIQYVVDRNKVLQALEKDLKLVNNAMLGRSVLVEVVSRKDIDFSRFGSDTEFDYDDFIQVTKDKIGTQFFKSGLEVKDLGVALNEKAYSETDKKAFWNYLQGRKPGDGASPTAQKAREYRELGTELLKTLSNVSIEFNVLSFTYNANKEGILQVNLTARRIDQPGGTPISTGLFKAARIDVNDPNAMIGALIEDIFEEMNRSFIPDVRNELSSLELDEGELVRYELILRGFDRQTNDKIRRTMKNRAIPGTLEMGNFENVVPGLAKLAVRWNGEILDLNDLIMDTLEKEYKIEYPSVSENAYDLVLQHIK